jgi:hypothetical protein
MRGSVRISTIQCALTLGLLAVLAYGILAPQGSVLALPAASEAGGTPTSGGTPRPARPAQATPAPGEGGDPAASPTLATPTTNASATAAGVPGTPVRSATPIVGRLGVSVRRSLSPLSFTLTGRTQVAQTTMEIEVLDTSALVRQPGWRLTLAVDQFRVVGSPARSLPGDAVSLVGNSVRCVNATGCGDPRNSIAYPLLMPPGEAMAIYDAAPGSGAGQFVITLTFEVRIPGNASAGSYVTTVEPGIAGTGRVASALIAAPSVSPSPTVAATPPPQVATATAARTSPGPTPPAPATAIVPSPTPTAPAVTAAELIQTPVPTSPTAFLATDYIGTTQSVYFRSGPGVTYPALDLLPRGTTLAASGESRVVAGILWRSFALEDGRTGWVRDIDVLPVNP